jgi:hypothetical protein
VLSQGDKLIGFYSSKLNPYQKKYTTGEKEALAIIKSLVAFKTIIFGCKIIVRTDHSILQFLNS